MAGALVELAAAVVEMHPLAGLDGAHGDADDDAEFDDGRAFGDGGEGDLVAELDFLARGQIVSSSGADNLNGAPAAASPSSVATLSEACT